MIEDTMTLLSLLGRIMRYFLLRPETLFLLCISLALWSYFFHTDEVKTIVKSSRDAVKMVKGKVAEIMQNDRLGGLDVLDAEFSKTWEFKNHNVAVYSIQGRRDHMEDRFEVITDLVNKTHPSIFGIFDGHGGEASFSLFVSGGGHCCNFAYLFIVIYSFLGNRKHVDAKLLSKFIISGLSRSLSGWSWHKWKRLSPLVC
ncbi:hypothetical protein JRQ81_018082 [Phrynocephalus forsythii]|uniref:Protein phosphatase 1L n=1 Tax=Phrynocephalus forsythii TaxID=171643 RepID=A0A9Q1B0Z0_9SAUR|nr:hypothetical protein JRQ81_018082 [Phrynocephalus forsythii]